MMFLPTWAILVGQLTGYCLDCGYARRLAARTEGQEEEELPEVRSRVCAPLIP